MLSILTQYNEFGLIILHLAVATIFIYHGWPKISSPQKMAAGMGWPSMVVRLLGAVEILGSLGILFGIQSQIAALLLALVMVGAIWTKMTKWHTPFFASDKTGWEFDFILLAVSLFILVS